MAILMGRRGSFGAEKLVIQAYGTHSLRGCFINQAHIAPHEVELKVLMCTPFFGIRFVQQ